MMYKFIFFLCFIPSLLQGQNSVEWEAGKSFDYGLLNQFEPSETVFFFTNISADTIVIDNVRTTCGCTAPEWDYEPIAPDEKRAIKVVYDAGKVGYFRKKIKVYFSNQRKGDILYIEGEVE